LGPLQCIVDADAASRAGHEPDDLARAFLDGGARVLQLRAKQLTSAAFLTLCDTVLGLSGPFRATVIVNDRVDLARLCGAAGVHVGQEDLPPAEARAQLGPAAIVGFSTHTLAQIDAVIGDLLAKESPGKRVAAYYRALM
jgi:thiamine-phosphate diphosphorylase